MNSILEIDSTVQYINQRDKNGETALHIAASRGDSVTSLKLLNRGGSYAFKNDVKSELKSDEYGSNRSHNFF